MRYVATVTLVGLAMIAAGPLAIQAAGFAPQSVPALEQAPRGPAPSVAELRAVFQRGDDQSAEAEAALSAFDFAAADLAGGREAAADDGASAGSAERLAGQIRVSLAAASGCPGEQQAFTIISAATRGWDVSTTGSALRIVGNDDLCPAVGAAVASVRDAAGEASRQNQGPLSPAGGGAPGGGGGPGYQQPG